MHAVACDVFSERRFVGLVEFLAFFERRFADQDEIGLPCNMQHWRQVAGKVFGGHSNRHV